jgi:hypothetical protein
MAAGEVTPIFELRRLFRTRPGAPCDSGAASLRTFAEASTTDLQFLLAEDTSDRTNSAFAGIPEWDAFAEHVASCRRCNA